MLDGGAAFQSLDADGLHDLVGRLSRHARPDHHVEARSAEAGPRIVAARRRPRAAATAGSWTATFWPLQILRRIDIASPMGHEKNVQASRPSISRRRTGRRAQRQTTDRRARPAERLAVDLAGLQLEPGAAARARERADHRLCRRSWRRRPKASRPPPREVTIAMMANFACRRHCDLRASARARLFISKWSMPARWRRRSSPGSSPTSRGAVRDFGVEAALEAELAFAFGCGQRAVARAGQPDLLIFGEMGIGSTTACARDCSQPSPA